MIVLMDNNATTAQNVTADFCAGEFFDGDDNQIEDVAQDAGGAVTGAHDANATRFYRFADGSALMVNRNGWGII